jgi:hypothetical protein
MGTESRPGLTVLSTLVNGERIGHMVRESLFMLMATSTMVSGPMIRQMDPVFINMSMAHNTKECGKTIFNTERVLKPGLTNLATKETTHSDASTVSEATSGTMDRSIWEIGKRTRFRELVSTLG